MRSRIELKRRLNDHLCGPHSYPIGMTNLEEIIFARKNRASLGYLQTRADTYTDASSILVCQDWKHLIHRNSKQRIHFENTEYFLLMLQYGNCRGQGAKGCFHVRYLIHTVCNLQSKQRHYRSPIVPLIALNRPFH